jgi:adenylosuccinate lyase
MWYRWVKRVENAFGKRHRHRTASDTVESFERYIIPQAIATISITLTKTMKVIYLLQTYLLRLAKPLSREFSISRLIWSAAK